MKKPVVDHLWSKIFDLETLGRSAAAQKLNEVVALSERISHSEGSDVVNTILDHGLIEAALRRCIQIQDREIGLDYDDLQIYARYATTAMKYAEQIIDKELAHLGL